MSAPSREDAMAAFDAAGFTGAIIPEGGRTTLFASELEAVGRALLAERERAASEYARGLAEGRELLMAVALEAWGYGCGTAEDASRFANMSRAEVDKEQRDDCAGIVERALSGAAKEDKR